MSTDSSSRPPAKKAHTNTANPWYGFSVNKDAEDIEYANEFIRFLATRPELDQIAEIKDVPPITKNADAERYTYVQKVQQSYIKPHIESFLESAAKKLASGELATAQEAADSFIESCSTVSPND